MSKLTKQLQTLDHHEFILRFYDPSGADIGMWLRFPMENFHQISHWDKPLQRLNVSRAAKLVVYHKPQGSAECLLPTEDAANLRTKLATSVSFRMCLAAELQTAPLVQKSS